MIIQYLAIVVFNILISLPVFISYSLIIKLNNNNPFLKKLKVFITIVTLERVFHILVQLIMVHYVNLENINAITTFIRVLNVVSDYIILPLSIIGVLILLYALVNIKERSDIYD